MIDKLCFVSGAFPDFYRPRAIFPLVTTLRIISRRLHTTKHYTINLSALNIISSVAEKKMQLDIGILYIAWLLLS